LGDEELIDGTGKPGCDWLAVGGDGCVNHTARDSIEP
jgi:hypothetical protein